MRSNASVKYVDIREGLNEAYLRCDSAEAATSIAEKSTNERRAQVLAGRYNNDLYVGVTGAKWNSM